MFYTWEINNTTQKGISIVITSPLINHKAWRLSSSGNQLQAEYYNLDRNCFIKLTLTPQFLQTNNIKLEEIAQQHIQECASLVYQQILKLNKTSKV